VVQGRGDAGLIQELVDEAGLLGELGQESLEDDEPIEPCHTALARQKDLAHATDHQPADDGVLAEDERSFVSVGRDSSYSRRSMRPAVSGSLVAWS
jgi:hypothetical protein